MPFYFNLPQRRKNDLQHKSDVITALKGPLVAPRLTIASVHTLCRFANWIVTLFFFPLNLFDGKPSSVIHHKVSERRLGRACPAALVVPWDRVAGLTNQTGGFRVMYY